VKVLPASFKADVERLARFRREAELLASLNHPNIAHVYGLEHAEGEHALVMELATGVTLAERTAAGPLLVDDAVAIARQVLDALEAAHDRGIVHRDLKPANIMIGSDGAVKVLDFGLAKAIGTDGAGPEMGQGSPVSGATVTSPAMTAAGMLLGTAAYMAPEQARGRAVDRRADLWAFGCVLYEMLTGARAFGGDDVTETLANVLKSEVRLGTIPANVPARVRQVIIACLQKEVRQRLASAQDARLLLEGVFQPVAPLNVAAPALVMPVWRRMLPYVVGALAATLVVGLLAWRLAPAAALSVTRFSIPIPEARSSGTRVGMLLPWLPMAARSCSTLPMGCDCGRSTNSTRA
jgi:serine/threonine-protein kinase